MSGPSAETFAEYVKNSPPKTSFDGTELLPIVLPNGSSFQRNKATLASLAAYVGLVGSGSVTSIGMTVPSFLSVSPATITSAGTFAISLATQAANLILAGPSSGSPATPTFRSIVPADVPTLNQNTTGTASNLSGTPILPNGTKAITQSANDNSTKIATTAYADAVATQGALLSANNLSDVASASSARTNLGLGTLATQSGTFSGTSSGTNTGDQVNISGNAATVTTNANLTGPVTSAGNATAIGSGVVTLAMQANMATASLVYRKTTGSGAPEVNTLATLKTDLGLTGTNTGDQSLSSLGGTTVGQSVFTLTNPSAVTFPRFNADNSVTALSASAFLSAIGGGTGNGTVTAVSVATTNGVSGSSSGGATPALTLTLGAITPSSVNGNTVTSGTGTLTLSTFTLTVAATASVSGSNTGDQVNVSGSSGSCTGNAATATALQSARTINGTSFDGTVNITVAAAGSTLSDTVPIAKGGTGQTTAVAAKDALTVKSADIPSAMTTDLSTATGEYVHVTGTTTITGLGTLAAGVERSVEFTGILTLTHNASSLILPGGASITTAAGDTAIFRSEGSGNWRCISYVRAASPPLSGTSTNTNTGDQTTSNSDGSITVATGSTNPVVSLAATFKTRALLGAAW